MSVYNEIFTNRGDIMIDCNPDQFSRDTIRIDEEDYREIKKLAQELGWEKPPKPPSRARKRFGDKN